MSYFHVAIFWLFTIENNGNVQKLKYILYFFQILWAVATSNFYFEVSFDNILNKELKKKEKLVNLQGVLCKETKCRTFLFRLCNFLLIFDSHFERLLMNIFISHYLIL